ncbi:MAG: NHL repeat-containing protein [Rhodocyclaceae bacterium]|nr:NHL repeat-containing protein [Rhodocyclaceae bacterium]
MRPVTHVLPFCFGLAFSLAPWAAPSVVVVQQAEQAEGLSRPHDGSFSPDGRLIYLTDMANSRISVLDANSLETLGHIGEGELAYPHDAEFDGAGRLLVADTGHGRIAIYAVDGARGRLVGELGGLNAPEGVAVLPDGRVAATQTGGGSLSVFRDGRLEREIGAYGSGPLQFIRPHDVDAAPDGSLYVVDSGNHRIQVLGPDLQLRAISDPALALNEPKYLVLVGDGLWLADEYNHRLLWMSTALALRAVLGSGQPGRAADAYRQPEAVLVQDGRLWVVDTYNDRILRLDWSVPGQ